MTDKKLTLLELHLNGDFQFGPKVMGGESTEDEDTEDGQSESEGDQDGMNKGGALIALVVLLVIAWLVKRNVGTGSETDEEPEIDVA